MLPLVLALVMAIPLFLSGASAEEMVSVRVDGQFMYAEARSMLSMINGFRTGNDAWYISENNQTRIMVKNLKPLNYDYNLEKVAMQRAAEIAVYFNHTRPNGTSWKTIYPGGRISRGENIGYGSGGGVAEIFDAFCETDKDYSGQGHRRNMLRKEFSRVGFGAFRSGNQLFWVQAFASGNAGGNAEESGNPSVEASWGVLAASGLMNIRPSVSEVSMEVGASVAMPDVIAYSHTGTSIAFPGQIWWPQDGFVGMNGDQLTGAAPGSTMLLNTFHGISMAVPASVVPSGTLAAVPAPAEETNPAEGEELVQIVEYDTALGIPETFVMNLDSDDECFETEE